MYDAKKSVLDYLRLDNPVVSAVHYHKDDYPQESRVKSANTSNIRYLRPKYIKQWDDFDFRSLEAIYGGQLREALARESIDFTDHSAIPRLPFREIHDGNSLEALLIKWNQSVVSDALKMTQSRMGAGQSHDQIYMVRGGQANRLLQFAPDWAGVPRSDSSPCRPHSILPGDTKVGWKWSSHKIQTGDTEDIWLEDDWLEPIKQIYTYCHALEARYGYIITEKELVVVRVRPSSPEDMRTPVDSQDSVLSFPSPKKTKKATSSTPLNCSAKNPIEALRREGTLEFKAIPWTSDAAKANTSDNSLTVNLALWWLHMMALESHGIDYWYPPLAETTWHQTSETQGPEVETIGPTFTGLGYVPTGAKRSRAVIPEEDDGSQDYQPPRRMARRSTRSKAKVRHGELEHAGLPPLPRVVFNALKSRKLSKDGSEKV